MRNLPIPLILLHTPLLLLVPLSRPGHIPANSQSNLNRPLTHIMLQRHLQLRRRTRIVLRLSRHPSHLAAYIHLRWGIMCNVLHKERPSPQHLATPTMDILQTLGRRTHGIRARTNTLLTIPTPIPTRLCLSNNNDPCLRRQSARKLLCPQSPLRLLRNITKTGTQPSNHSSLLPG